MKRGAAVLFAVALLAAVFTVEAPAAPQDFGLQSVKAALSTTQAGDHPDLSFSFEVKQDPASTPNAFGLHDSYATTRNIRFELPPGLIGNPNVLGVPQQCTVQDLVTYSDPNGGCPNGSQIGVSSILAYELDSIFTEPVYMMEPPGGDVVARVGLIAGIFPTFVDFRVRSESDYGLTAEISDAPTSARLIKADITTWGVPADHSHDTERCTAVEAFHGCVTSEPRPAGSRPLPFLTNPTRCGVPLSIAVAASSWAEPSRFDTKSASFPQITGCNTLPFGPTLTVEPTSHHVSAPTGLEITLRLPAAEGVKVLEPSEMRDIKIDLPVGIVVNPGSADGLGTCSPSQVGFGTREASHCPDAAKLADTEFDIPALPRRMKGSIYLREPEPHNLFRIWVVADDLGAHVKLPGQLVIDNKTGQIKSIVLDSPQVPLREVTLFFKSGFRAPLATPPSCGRYLTHFEFVPWSGNSPVRGTTPMTIDQGCGETGGFSPKLSAGTTTPAAGQHAPFLFTLTREDGEQNPETIDVTAPPGLAASFAGIPRCEGQLAELGQCSAASRLGKVKAATGYGPTPLWVPQPGKRPTAVYLGGRYNGAPFSIITVVPAEAGPFDLGDVVVRSALFVDPVTGQGIVRSDPLPQIIEGIPISYRTVQVDLDRPNFTLNPTGCKAKQTQAVITSTLGAVAKPTSPFQVVNCARLPFQPKLSLKLAGGTRRGAHPRLRAMLKARPGDANIGAVSAALPHSEFLDQGHIGTVCTRVQFAAKQCPPASIYGRAVVKTPLLANPLEGPVYLRSSSHPLPDLVMRLEGEVEIDLVGRVDSINGGIRTTFESPPDAPVTSVVLTMQGGKKGLLVNSTNLCAKVNRATVKFTGQNARQSTLHPKMQASCN